MDPPFIRDSSFSAANAGAYILSEIWPFPSAGSSGELGGGLGLRMGSFGGGCFADASPVAAVPLNRDVSVDESTVTEQSGSRGGSGGGRGGRKRKNVNSEDKASKMVSTVSANDLNDSDGKRMKASGPIVGDDGSKGEAESSSKTGNKNSEQSSKPEPPKDYIHVRARRGQATDSHSLAERARREKISERMKILQDLVPGCNKVIGKALVLDEIINYVQSLQRQVEFLSMKLEAVTPRMDTRIDGFLPKEVAAPTFDASGMMFASHTPRE